MSPPRTVYTACRICAGQCGLAIDLDERGRIDRIRGDHGNPLTRGYACIKGLTLDEAHASPRRILHPLKRMPDGHFAPIALDDALDEIAATVNAIITEDGPDAVAGFRGTMNYTDSLSAHMLPAWLTSLGSHSFFSTMTIDQSAKWVTARRLGYWEAGKDPYGVADTLLIIGANPLVSLSTFTMVMQNPVKALKEAKARGVRLLVIDPRRTETAAFADLHLQPLPGEDAALLAGMLRLIFEQDWPDHSFCAANADGIDKLRAAVEPFTPAEVASRCDISAEALFEMTHAFAAPHPDGRRKRGAAVSGTGPNMGPWSNLAEHLVECLNIVCGRFAREGDSIGNPGVLGARYPRRAQAVGPDREWDHGWRDAWGHGLLMGERMSAMLPEAIEGDGVGAVRALFVDGGNPVNALAQSGASAKAFAQLRLLVSIDPFLNATSRLAHYILPPPMMLERDDIRSRDWETHTLQVPYSQFSAAVVERPEGSELIDAWRVYWEIARRTGHAIDFDGVPIDMAAAPPADTLFRILLRHSAYSADKLLAETRGRVFPSEPMVVGPRQSDAQCFQVAPPDIVAELAALAAARRPPQTLRLACRRLRDVQNSMYHDLPSIAGRVAVNPLAMHPDDLADRGLQCGATVRITSEHGEAITTAKADPTLRRGVVTLHHGWGDGRGVNVNNLTSLSRQRQAINAMPILSGFDVEVSRAD